MNAHLPYFELLNHQVQQLMLVSAQLKSIDKRIGEQQQAQYAHMMAHLEKMDHRMEAFIQLMMTKTLFFKEWLDNNDLMAMFSIQKSKLYDLKHRGYFKVYDLDGKELCKHEQVNQAVLNHPKVFTSVNK